MWWKEERAVHTHVYKCLLRQKATNSTPWMLELLKVVSHLTWIQDVDFTVNYSGITAVPAKIFFKYRKAREQLVTLDTFLWNRDGHSFILPMQYFNLFRII